MKSTYYILTRLEGTSKEFQSFKPIFSIDLEIRKTAIKEIQVEN